MAWCCAWLSRRRCRAARLSPHQLLVLQGLPCRMCHALVFTDTLLGAAAMVLGPRTHQHMGSPGSGPHPHAAALAGGAAAPTAA